MVYLPVSPDQLLFTVRRKIINRANNLEIEGKRRLEAVCDISRSEKTLEHFKAIARVESSVFSEQ